MRLTCGVRLAKLMKSVPTNFQVIVPTLLLGCLSASMLIPSIWDPLAFFPCGGVSPLGLITYLTYWLVIASPAQFILASASVVLSAKTLGHPLQWRKFISVWLGGAVVGSVVYGWLENSCSPLVGPYPLSWTFGGYACLVGAFEWKTRPTWAKIYIVLLVSALLTLPLLSVSIMASQAASFACGALLAYRSIVKPASSAREQQ